jgi:hypothetical protein
LAKIVPCGIILVKFTIQKGLTMTITSIMHPPLVRTFAELEAFILENFFAYDAHPDYPAQEWHFCAADYGGLWMRKEGNVTIIKVTMPCGIEKTYKKDGDLVTFEDNIG